MRDRASKMEKRVMIRPRVQVFFTFRMRQICPYENAYSMYTPASRFKQLEDVKNGTTQKI